MCPALALAAGQIPELEGPIQRFVASISGPIALAIATLIVMGAGFAWASSEGLAFHRLTNVVLGISIALFASVLVATVWARQAAAQPLVGLASSWWALLVDEVVSLLVQAGVLLGGSLGSIGVYRRGRLRLRRLGRN